MQNKHILLFAFLLLLSPFIKAQKTFMKTYGDSLDDANLQVVITPDGKILTVGYEKDMDNTTNFFGRKVYLNWFDTDGNHTDTKALGYLVEEKGYDVSITSNGDLLLCSEGKYIVNTNCGTDAFFVRTNPQGAKTWAKGIGGLLWDDIQCSVELPGGDIVALGNTASYGAGNFDAWIGRFTTSGDTLWTRTYGSTVTNVTSAQETARKLVVHNGYFYACGTIYQESDGKFYPWIFKTDSNGQLIWSKLLNTGTTVGSMFDLKVSQNHLIAYCSNALCKLDTAGNLLNLKGLPATFIPQFSNAFWSGMSIGADGSILLSGMISSKAALVKLDTAFSPLWAQTYPDAAYSYGFGTSVTEMVDGRIVMAGLVSDGTHLDCRLWVTEPDGSLGSCSLPVTPSPQTVTGTLTNASTTVMRQGFMLNPNVGANSWVIPPSEFFLEDTCAAAYNPTPTHSVEWKENEFGLYPNPAEDFVMLEGITNVPASLTLVSVTGQEWALSVIPMDSGKMGLSLQSLPSGIYLVMQEGTVLGKLVRR